MRSDKYNNKQNKSKKGFKTFTMIWSILFLLTTLTFVGVLIHFNMLPSKYLYIGLSAAALLTLLIFPALFFKGFKKSRKIIALALSIFLMGAYGLGIIYMTGTLDFFSKITNIGVPTEEFYVVVKDDGPYDKIEDIKGKTVETYLNNERNYSEAKNKLGKEVNVNYEMIENLSDMADGLLNDEYDILFISESHYTTISSQHETFKADTKIIYTVKVEIESQNVAKEVDVTSEPFNIYISGLDIEGSIDILSRSDVNMIMTVNPTTHKIILTSIPRDYLVQLPGKGDAQDKLTHTGIYGISETIGAVEKLMGIDINYYAKVNYSTVTELVDAIGGIDVISDYNFDTHGMDVYYTFYEGENHLDGPQALAFARERQSFEDGDFQRNKNQQTVLKAILTKCMSSSTILTSYTSILNSVEDYAEINMSQRDIQKLAKFQLNGMPSWSIETQHIEGQLDTTLCYSTGEYLVSVVDPDEESIVTAVDKIVSVMEEGKNDGSK